MPTPLTPFASRHVAVIGAGAAGLVAARELHREGHKVTVFERQNQVGGTWVYTDRVEPDPLSLNHERPIIHTSLYESLRTNLPREVMGYRDYPFVYRPGTESHDPRMYPGHAEVLAYLKEFAIEFSVEEMIKFETQIDDVRLVDDSKWKVKLKRISGESKEEVFDAVVICNGHYTEPRLADIPGVNLWPGKQMHSHNYRVPEPFRDQVVVLIGSSASAVDICRDIATVAKQVHVASRSVPDETYEKQPGHDNMWQHSMIESAREDGTVVFRNGRSVRTDVILHCTGYKYHFPFLETNGIVTVDDNRVGPLYKHIFPPTLAPWLSFVGLPWKVIPFPLCEYQSKWIAGVLSGRILLPSQERMMEDVKAFYSELESSGIPKRYTHQLGDAQFEYNDWLGAQCGYPGSEEWRKEMYILAGKYKRTRPETYRDDWDNDHLVLQAYQDFAQNIINKAV
ncbi:flavin-containing monooxygenase FMO GS-OX-like 4 [Rutidosis leptorrhynchoides]|uniref:flavin-containing monooxygenase FMO GS-OX-like 4 n=1 Tax=Rutidosis leptorrhynchoides TaxID=125765 RepID=UPI003A99BFE1